jgi:hypothetical protein
METAFLEDKKDLFKVKSFHFVCESDLKISCNASILICSPIINSSIIFWSPVLALILTACGLKDPLYFERK